jgi:hypothetical protein
VAAPKGAATSKDKQQIKVDAETGDVKLPKEAM